MNTKKGNVFDLPTEKSQDQHETQFHATRIVGVQGDQLHGIGGQIEYAQPHIQDHREILESTNSS